ncbi:MAG: sigma-54-dependent Fis family transcriptional regulator, partial [Gammaproteobacteria bacterium]|nr:sigma-54-dependent Fis family transcriptional regulator [Gammaproteobacteria bacterium]
MSTSAKQLSAEDRRFFALVADVIFSNPFSTEYQEVAARLSEVTRLPASSSKQRYLDAVARVLGERLDQLAAKGLRRVGDVQPRDRSLLEYALLFRCYHAYNDAFDALIETQLKRGDESVAVAFADELLAQLQDAGICSNDALRYISLFYQLRRAYHFIDQTLVGQSPSMKQLRHALWNNVFTQDIRTYGHHLWGRMEDFSTLLLGETGSGKGAAAAAIGRSGAIPFDPASGRFKASFTTSFIATNLSQFPESLIESELFGHRKGAFTGAIDNHQGIFQRCSAHGALFLDEIGDVSLPTQIKLLNVLQDRRFSPVGSHQVLKFAGRVIAATNRPLDQLRSEGRFRDDFYYRLCSDVIQVPSLSMRLREQADELESLTALLIQRLTGAANPSLLGWVLERLAKDLPPGYPWPGNVRELEQAVRRVILTGSYQPDHPPTAPKDAWLRAIAEGQLSAQQLLADYCYRLYQQLGSYERVAEQAGLDRRTAKKYIDQAR